MRIYVTGQSGFVGGYVAGELQCLGHIVNPLNDGLRLPSSKKVLASFLEGYEVVVHCAGIAHTSFYSEDERIRLALTNIDGTQGLVEAAFHAGVRRFIYISSSKVFSEFQLECGIGEGSTACPTSLYGYSKLMGEARVQETCKAGGMDYLIIRPPLVYGPDAKANFASLLSYCLKSPLIFLVQPVNSLSLIYIRNLTDYITKGVEYNGALTSTCMISDKEIVSTNELLKLIMSKRCNGDPLVLDVEFLMKLWESKNLYGSQSLRKLMRSSFYKVSSINSQFEWCAPYSLEEGLARTISDFEERCAASE